MHTDICIYELFSDVGSSCSSLGNAAYHPLYVTLTKSRKDLSRSITSQPDVYSVQIDGPQDPFETTASASMSYGAEYLRSQQNESRVYFLAFNLVCIE